ncbi:hypothetical protein SKAU_G00284590 [Synaphobranchus kaupii]|uniref:Docking protein 2 n=1 Tax=Synaphobranchus kaupii TaxID=118154 RepID=A0A9Q1EXQ0_SYNKA|nr:hypothetical protein SKAU_G00284590 [Synaphobranchus kaupii]
MEDEVRKRGILYLQQQKFGKKWKKVWLLVYGDSGCSVSRLEVFECRDDAERTERKRSKRDSKKVIRMCDFVRVAEEKVAACPRGCGTFLVETTEKSFLFAAETSELGDWIQTLCEIAFPMNQGQPEALMSPSAQDYEMVENSIYCTSSELKDFHVTVRKSEASVRCKLHGSFVLRVDLHSLHLLNPESGVTCFTWPYQYIRKFGLNMSSFSFEAGRMSDSGEGIFEFETKQNDRILHAINTAIGLQSRRDGAQDLSTGPASCCRPIALDDSGLYSQVNKGRRPCPSAEALLAGVEEMALDDISIRDPGWGLSKRPLPTPNSHVEPSLARETCPDGLELSETEPDYEEVGAGAVAPAVMQMPQSPYDNIEMVKGQALIIGRESDPVGKECPDNPGIDENVGCRHLKRMLTNPCYQYEVDTEQMTHTGGGQNIGQKLNT